MHSIHTVFYNYMSFYRLTFENVLRKQELGDEAMDEDNERKVIVVEPHVQPKRGPYLYNEPKKYVSYTVYHTVFIIAHKDKQKINIIR